MQKIAYSYVRFSTKGQFSGDSLSRQLKKARDYATAHNLLLDESSYQDLGISAFKGKNVRDGALGAFLKAVDEGLIPTDTTLLLESLDRLSRAKPTEALGLFIGIINRGVTLVTLAESTPQVYNTKKINSDNGMSLFGSMMVLIRAHEESATKSMRVKSAKAAALKAGKKHGKCPFWLQVNDDRQGFTIIEEQAAIVREVFKQRLEGIGSLRIARYLNANCGFKYGSSQAARLLLNPAVIGTRMSQVGQEPLLDYYPSIIDKVLFYEVQRLMTASLGTKRGQRPEDEPNLFTGLARCALCGSSMRFFRESRSVNQRYIRCLSAVTGAGCDAQGYVNYDAFEKEVIGWLLLDQDEEVVSLLEKKPTRKVVSSAELQALREQQSRLIELAATGTMPIKLVSDKLNALELQIKDQEAALIAEPVDEDEVMFAEKAWALVERHEDAKLGDDKEELYAVRRELKASFQRSLECINVYPEGRIGDVYHCKFSVGFRGYDGVPTREYTRPALIRIKGVWNK